MQSLRAPLLASGVYIILTGFTLLLPSLASVVLGMPILDAAVMSGAGSAILPIGLLAIFTARKVERYGGIAWFFVLAFLFGAIDVAVYWAMGAYSARSALAPILVDLALAWWIIAARSRATHS